MDKFDKPSKRDQIFAGDGVNKQKPKGKKKSWQFHEKHVAKVFKGKVTPGSGNKPMHKGDVKSDSFMVECKMTKNESMSLKLEWLTKISEEATCRDRIPAMHIRFETANGNICEKDWVILPETVFKEMLEKNGDNDVGSSD